MRLCPLCPPEICQRFLLIDTCSKRKKYNEIHATFSDPSQVFYYHIILRKIGFCDKDINGVITVIWSNYDWLVISDGFAYGLAMHTGKNMSWSIQGKQNGQYLKRNQNWWITFLKKSSRLSYQQAFFCWVFVVGSKLWIQFYVGKCCWKIRSAHCSVQK